MSSRAAGSGTFGRWLSAVWQRQLPTLAAAFLTALLALALARLPLPLAGLLAAGLGFGLALLLWPALGLYALALIIPFGPVLRVGIGPASAGVTDVLLGATVFAWFMRFCARLQTRRPAPLLWLILPFFAALLYSTLAAQSLEEAIPELLKWVEFAAVYFLAAQMLSPRHRLPLALALLTAAAVEATIGLRQFWFRIGPEAYQLGAFLRAYGTFGQPNPFAGYLGLLLPLGLALSLWALPAVWAGNVHRGAKLTLAAVCIGLSAIIGAGLVASWSRGGWLGAGAAALAVLAFSSFAGRAAILAGGVVAFLASPFFPNSIRARLSDLVSYFGVWDVRGASVTDANFAVVERVAHWQAAWGMLADHVWLGVGVGNWAVAYPRYAIAPWTDPLGHAHNVLFHYAAEAGLIGAVAYLWFWLGSLFIALRSAVRSHGLERAIAIGILGMLVHMSVHNQFDNLFVQGMPLVIALGLGLLPLPGSEHVRSQPAN